MSALSFLRRVPFSSSFPCPQGHIGPGTEFGFTLPSTNLKEPLEALSQASGHHRVCVRIDHLPVKILQPGMRGPGVWARTEVGRPPGSGGRAPRSHQPRPCALHSQGRQGELREGVSGGRRAGQRRLRHGLRRQPHRRRAPGESGRPAPWILGPRASLRPRGPDHWSLPPRWP